jgi:hypothetical protein
MSLVAGAESFDEVGVHNELVYLQTSV